MISRVLHMIARPSSLNIVLADFFCGIEQIKLVMSFSTFMHAQV
jgi:hypothetical protein